MAKRTGKSSHVDAAKLGKKLAGAARVRREALGLKTTTKTKSVGAQIAKIAGKQGMVVEWTLRPVDASETVAVGCFCGCGCSCIA